PLDRDPHRGEGAHTVELHAVQHLLAELWPCARGIRQDQLARAHAAYGAPVAERRTTPVTAAQGERLEPRQGGGFIERDHVLVPGLDAVRLAEKLDDAGARCLQQT